MFTENFVNFTEQVKNENNLYCADKKQEAKFKKNEEFLMSGSVDDPLPFPEDFAKNYPFQIREIFEYLTAVMRKKDLVGFLQGNLFSEKIINMYFKILEKMNLV